MIRILLALCALCLAPALASALPDVITTTDGKVYAKASDGFYYPAGANVPKQMAPCKECGPVCPCPTGACAAGACVPPARVPEYLPRPTMPQTPKRVLYYQQKCEPGRCTLVPVYAP